jgi:hypothetical protein
MSRKNTNNFNKAINAKTKLNVNTRRIPVYLKSNSKKSAKNNAYNIGNGHCLFPFTWKGRKYNKCAPLSSTSSKKICATKVNKKSHTLNKYAYCPPPKKPIPTPEKYSDNKLYKQIGEPLIKGIFDLVIGNVQSGKTNVILSHCVKIIKHDMTAIVITRPLNADSSQLKTRMANFNDEQKLNTNEKLIFKELDSKSETKKKIIDKYNTIIVKGNTTQLNNIYDILNKEKEKNADFNFCLCIDEIDLFSGDGIVINSLIKLFCLKPYHILGLTATPLAVIMDIREKHLFPNRIFKLEPGKAYVGIDSDRIQFNNVSSIKGGRIRNESVKLQELQIVYDILSKCTSDRKFCISLILSTAINDNQKELLLDIIDNYKEEEELVGLVYNQKNVEIIVNKRTSTRLFPRIIDNKIKDGETRVFPGTFAEKDKWKDASAIQIALQYLKLDNITKIIIVSGMKADRGLSFVDGDYLADLQYHLTDLYIRSEIKKGKKSSIVKNMYCEKLIQKLRILGVYNDYNDLENGQPCYSYSRDDMPNGCKLNIWSTPELETEIKSCYEQIQIYQRSLLDVSKGYSKREELPYINNIKEWKSILENIKQSKKYSPSIPSVKPKMKEKYRWKLTKFDNIIYDDKTDGWCLKEHRNSSVSECSFKDCTRIEEDVDIIVKELHTKFPDKFSLDIYRHQLTYFIPNIDCNAYKSSISSIFKDPDFKIRSEVLKQLPKEIDLNSIYIIKSFLKTSHAASRIRNRYEQLISESEGHEGDLDDETKIFTWGKEHKYKFPLYFRYGSTTKGGDECNALIDINFLFDFKYTNNITGEDKLIKTYIKDGDIFWWQNLDGKVFVSTKSIEHLSDNGDPDEYIGLNDNTNNPCEGILGPGPGPRPMPGPIKFDNNNPKIKTLFNELIIPTILQILLKKNSETLDFILLDNKLNSVITIIENKKGILTNEELLRIKFHIIEGDLSEYKAQKDSIEKIKISDEIPTYWNNVSIENDDYKEFLKKNKFPNKFLYPDTCGSDPNPSDGGWPKYHEDLIKENLDSKIIIGTYSQHSYPKSHLAREIKQNKTIVYEYGIKTIMKTYISINNDIYEEWINDYILKYPTLSKPLLDNYDILEANIKDYKKIEEINKEDIK